jgi:hypothetical protein
MLTIFDDFVNFSLGAKLGRGRAVRVFFHKNKPSRRTAHIFYENADIFNCRFVPIEFTKRDRPGG